MRKISLTLVAVLMLCVFVFAGCTKANTATLKTCYTMYQDITQEYSQTNQYLFDKDNDYRFDLHSQKAYNQYAYQAINNEVGDFKLLKQGQQYQVMVDTALSFIEKYDTYLNFQGTLSYEDKVEQSYKTKLYIAIQDLKSGCEDLIVSKNALLIMCNKNIEADNININILQNLKRFIKSYIDFIGKAINISVAYEELFNAGMVLADTTTIQAGEGARLYESAKLYLAQYLYITHMQNQTEEFINFTQTQSYKDLVSLINGTNITYDIEPSKQQIQNYNIIRQKVENFKIGLNNLQIAVKNQQQNEQYQTYINNFEQEAINFATYAKTYLLQA